MNPNLSSSVSDYLIWFETFNQIPSSRRIKSVYIGLYVFDQYI